jgi:hypothetical protein
MASNHGNRERKIVERAKEIITDDSYFPRPYYVTFHWQKSRRDATVITIYNNAAPSIKEDLEAQSNDCNDNVTFEGWKEALEVRSIHCTGTIML